LIVYDSTIPRYPDAHTYMYILCTHLLGLNVFYFWQGIIFTGNSFAAP